VEGVFSMSPRVNSYDVIVDAAEAVVIEAGAAHMTLDAVAARAGVSKGGLLHHFPTKEALLKAMIDRLIGAREDKRKKILNQLPDEPARELKAYILSGLVRDPKADRMGAPILAALAHNPKLAEPIREIIKKRYAEFVSKGLKFERAIVLALATDGLLFQEVVSLSPFTEEQRKKVIEELLRIAEEGIVG
jgi:AcrR family transcriptional regulator